MFDPAVIDWDHYVHEIHLPSVLEHTRVRTKPGKSVVDKRPDRQRKAILSPDRHLAVFDLEHTLMSSNVVDTYAWLASRHLSPRGVPASWLTSCARHRRCSRWIGGTVVTSSAPSTAALKMRH